jgi:hypothetical protein
MIGKTAFREVAHRCNLGVSHDREMMYPLTESDIREAELVMNYHS